MDPESQVPAAPTPPPLPDTSELQFDKAEFTGRQCAFCNQAITGDHYQFGASVVCATCAPGIANQLERPRKSELMRALVFGFGAAVASAIAMGIVAWWGWQLALLSIFAGQMIAKAMKHATGQKGSRALQIWAVGLTYFACTVSLAPIIVKGFLESAAEDEKKAGKKKTEEPKANMTASEAAAGLGLATALLVGISMISPFLMIGEGISGILNILIIGFGLMQAWKGAAAIDIPLLGPYSGETP